jgi:hypothetical protein
MISGLLMTAISCGPSLSVPGTGRVSVQIKSRLAEIARGRSSQERSLRSTGDRAIAFFDRWSARIEDAQGSTVDSNSVSIYSQACDLVAPAGTGYKVYLDVYNSAVSLTEPTVSGVANDVTVAAGTTSQLRISCLPAQAEPLAAGTPSPAAVFEPYKDTVGGMTGTEKWYSIAPSAGYIVLTTDFDTGTAPLWGLFDSTGAYCASSAILTSSPSSVGVSVKSGASYYLALLNYAGQGSISISYSAGTPPPEDNLNNNTLNTAYPLSADTAISGIANLGNPDFFALDVAAPHELHIALTELSPGSNVGISLLDGAGNALTDGYGSVELVFPASAAGTYYLEITGTTADQYSISWR